MEPNDAERINILKVFHLRGIHWVPVLSGGR